MTPSVLPERPLPRVEAGQVWSAAGLMVSVLAADAGWVWFRTSQHPEQRMEAGPFGLWLLGIGAILTRDRCDRPGPPPAAPAAPLPAEAELDRLRCEVAELQTWREHGQLLRAGIASLGSSPARSVGTVLGACRLLAAAFDEGVGIRPSPDTATAKTKD